MKQIKIIVIFSFLLFLVFKTKAGSWVDPSWKEMIDSSDVIALVEYTTKGDFKAKAKPLKIYKGKLSSSEIWISGFSNRYGPIDVMKPGDKYIVFLNSIKLNESRLNYWIEKVKEEPELSDYFESLKAGKAFYVWLQYAQVVLN